MGGQGNDFAQSASRSARAWLYPGAVILDGNCVWYCAGLPSNSSRSDASAERQRQEFERGITLATQQVTRRSAGIAVTVAADRRRTVGADVDQSAESRNRLQ